MKDRNSFGVDERSHVTCLAAWAKEVDLGEFWGAEALAVGLPLCAHVL